MAEAAHVLPRTFAAGTIHRKTRTVLTAIPVDGRAPEPGAAAPPLRRRRRSAELAASIAQHGILQPVIVKRDGDGYLIMAGERRYRAAQLAGLSVIPALVRDDDPLEIAIIENLQREDLSPLEEAEGLGALIDQYGYTHEALAELIGKSRPYVSNTLALRRLPERHQARVPRRARRVARDPHLGGARRDRRSGRTCSGAWPGCASSRCSASAPSRPGSPGRSTRSTSWRGSCAASAASCARSTRPAFPPEQRRQLERLLRRTQARVSRTMARLAAVTSEEC